MVIKFIKILSFLFFCCLGFLIGLLMIEIEVSEDLNEDDNDDLFSEDYTEY